MTKVFENYLREETSMSEADIAAISSLSIPRTLRRNEHLLNAGDVCRHKTFIVRGMLRTYGFTEDGNEAILQFSPELKWTLDVESYDKRQPSCCHIAAVEPTQILQWQKGDFDQLLASIPGLKKYSEQLISRNTYASRARLLTALSASPKEKYEDFANKFPDLLSRVPLKMVAAYLGISLKTLTRIRHKQWAGQ